MCCVRGRSARTEKGNNTTCTLSNSLVGLFASPQRTTLPLRWNRPLFLVRPFGYPRLSLQHVGSEMESLDETHLPLTQRPLTTKTLPPHRQELHVTPDFPTSNVLVRNQRRRRRPLPSPRRQPRLDRRRAQRPLPHASHDGRHHGHEQAGRRPGDGRPVSHPGRKAAGLVAVLGTWGDHDGGRRGATGGVADVSFVVCVFWGPFRSAMEARGERYSCRGDGGVGKALNVPISGSHVVRSALSQSAYDTI